MTKRFSTFILSLFFIASTFISASSALAKTPTVIGAALSTDIVACLNGCDIRSFNVGGYTMIIAEDLTGFGFDVKWDGDTRTLRIHGMPDGQYIESVSYYPGTPSMKIGEKMFDVYSTDIVTFIEDVPVQSFNIGGYTVINFEELSRYGKCIYDNGARKLYVNVPWYGATAWPDWDIQPGEGHTGDSLSVYVDEVVSLVNSEREKAGLLPLEKDEKLMQAAKIRAQELEVLFSHTRPDGTRCFSVFDQAGVNNYFLAGENIAMGQSSPKNVMTSWMNSDGHRANILGKSFTHIGVGIVFESGNYHWVQMFIGR